MTNAKPYAWASKKWIKSLESKKWCIADKRHTFRIIHLGKRTCKIQCINCLNEEGIRNIITLTKRTKKQDAEACCK